MRIETKYRINLNKKNKVFREFLNAGYFNDKNCIDYKPYTVNSIYFDTSDLLTYRDKINGINKRFKLRIRYYENSDVYNLEIKNKNGYLGWKNKISLTYDDLKEYFILNKGKIKNFLMDNYPNFFPKIFIKYERTSIEDKLSNRISFDENLRWGKIDIDKKDFCSQFILHPLKSNEVIMEIKVPNNNDKIISNIIKKNDLIWIETSKYVICIEQKNEFYIL